MRSELLVCDHRHLRGFRGRWRDRIDSFGKDRLVGDRMFTSEGDSVNVGRLGPAGRADRWDDAPPLRSAGADGAVVSVMRRLQAHTDKQLWLLDRMRSDHGSVDPAALNELAATARRVRRYSQSVLLLCDQDAGQGSGTARRLSDVLSDAAAAVEDPRRVDVRSAPAATVASAAAVEFLHVLGELVDHVTAVYPGARIDLASRVEPLGGVTVDVAVDGIGRHDLDAPGARGALAAAEQLAQRSRQGIELRRPVGGPPTAGSGLVSSVHCPAGAVTVEETAWPSGSPSGAFRTRTNGTGSGYGATRSAPAPAHPRGPTHTGGVPAHTNGGEYTNGSRYANGSPYGNGADRPATRPSGRGPGADEDSGHGDSGHGGIGHGIGHGAGQGLGAGQGVGQGINGLAGPGYGNGRGGAPGNGSGTTPGRGEGRTNGYATGSYSSSAPASGSSRKSHVDELFGPLLDLPLEPIDDRFSTPIFEAIASAWFREDPPEQRGNGRGRPDDVPDWESPSDQEWRAAAARANRPDPEPTTATGLPRRRPGNQLVPPPLSRRRPPEPPAERVPDRVRDRLSTYQRGLRQGRHRAPNQDSGDYEEW